MLIFRKKSLIQLLSIGILFVTISCKKDEEEVLPACTDVHWEYSGLDGPDQWANLCVDYVTCSGTMQSPIDLKGAVTDPTLSDISQSYLPSSTHIINNGHTLQFNYDAGSTITLGGEVYKLLQFHTHTNSEHSVNGAKSPMEIHFVHKNDVTGKLAVIGVLVKVGAENSTLKKIASNKLPTTKNGVYDDAALSFSATDLMPSNKSYFTYGGSLTTPPCSETVTWTVFEQAIEASSDQIKNFEMIEQSNARPIQSLGNRTIRYKKG
jgi:carbonic anhydrase